MPNPPPAPPAFPRAAAFTLRIPQLAVLALWALLLAGCLDYREEIWLEKDGSGRMNAQLTVNLGGLDLPPGSGNGNASESFGTGGLDGEEFRRKLEGQDGIRVLTVESTREAGKYGLKWAVAFDSLAALKALDGPGPSAAGNEGSLNFQGDTGQLIGDISWKEAGGKRIFSRGVGEDPAGGVTPMGVGMAGMMFAGAGLEYTVHFPGQVETTNGTLLDDKRTVRWNVPLTQLMVGRTTMTAEVKSGPDIPWLWIGIGVFIVVDLIVTALVLAWAFKRRREQASTPVTAAAPPPHPQPQPPGLRSRDEDFRPR
jgi:hypothetical protein